MVVLGPVQEEDVTEGIQRSAPCNSMHTCPLLRFTAHQFFLSFFWQFCYQLILMEGYDPSFGEGENNGLLQHQHLLL